MPQVGVAASLRCGRELRQPDARPRHEPEEREQTPNTDEHAAPADVVDENARAAKMPMPGAMR